MLHKSIRSACTEFKSTALPRTDCISHLERQYREAGEGRVFPILPQTEQNKTALHYVQSTFSDTAKVKLQFCTNTCSMCKPAICPGKDQHYTHLLPVHLDLNTRAGNGSEARDNHLQIESQIYLSPWQQKERVM